MATLVHSTLPQLFKIYAQQIKNLDDPDDLSSDVLLVLLTRDTFADHTLSEPDLQKLERLDNELVKRWETLAEELPNPSVGGDRCSWWWHLDEGPQVREEARALARAE